MGFCGLFFGPDMRDVGIQSSAIDHARHDDLI